MCTAMHDNLLIACDVVGGEWDPQGCESRRAVCFVSHCSERLCYL